MSSQFGVIAWKMRGGEPLDPEEVEVCQLKKLVIKDNCNPRPGVAVCLQYKQDLWEGTIISLHGKKKNAEKALEAESMEPDFQDSETTTSVRSRKKKTFGDDFVREESQGEEVARRGKKGQPKSSKDKEMNGEGSTENQTATEDLAKKQKESEKRKMEKQKQREILKERNTLMLSRMASMSKYSLEDYNSADEEDNFHSRSLLDDCLEMMTPAPRSRPSHSTPNSFTSTSPILIHSPSSPPVSVKHNYSSFTHVTTPQNTQPPFNQQESTSPEVSPSISLQSNGPMPEERPTFGGKCPRRRQLDQVTNDQESPEDSCSSCKRLKKEIVYLRGQLALYREQNDQTPPRAGKVHPAVAERFKMIELSPGSGVYVFDRHVDQAISRSTPTSCVAFLLNCFYTNTELQGMNLTGANGKLHPDKDINESMIAFTIKKHSGATAAMLKASLRNKIAANTSRASKAN